jgi:hypothetical protein
MDKRIAMLYNLRLVLLISSLFSFFSSLGPYPQFIYLAFTTVFLFCLTFVKQKWVPPVLVLIIIVSFILLPKGPNENPGPNAGILVLFNFMFLLSSIFFAVKSRALFNKQKT